MKRLYKVLDYLPLVLVFTGTVFVRCFNIIIVVIPVDTSFHFGLMTVNALFGGFLYSNYSILVGLIDNSTIQRIHGTNIMEKRNTLASKGIMYAALSVLSGIYISLMVDRTGKMWDILSCFAINCEIVFMVTAIMYYLLSLRSTNSLTKALYEDEEALGKDEVSARKDAIVHEGKQRTDNIV